MNEKSFWDTCIAIAFVFHLNSLHSASHKVFNSYSEHYWSDFVKQEFKRRRQQKIDNLTTFFNDLRVDLNSPAQEFYSPNDLVRYAVNKYDGRLKDDAKNSVDSFWNEYVGFQSQIPFYNLKSYIAVCLNDLRIKFDLNTITLNQNLHLTPQRTNDYESIELKLKSNGVKKADRHVALDGHDFALKSSDPIDFITFDYDLFYGSKNVDSLAFDSIKGKYDFIFS